MAQRKDCDECNLIVNYLPLSYRERHPSKLFSQIGEIKSCRIMRFIQQDRPLSKGFGFVKFHNLEDAKRAIRELDGSNVLGKHIKVSFARPGADRSQSNLFVCQLPKRFNGEDLKDIFKGHGTIIESRVLFHENGQSRRCGFVRFDKDSEAKTAMEKLNKTRPTPKDAPIRIRIAVAAQHDKIPKASKTKSNAKTEQLEISTPKIKKENVSNPLPKQERLQSPQDLNFVDGYYPTRRKIIPGTSRSHPHRGPYYFVEPTPDFVQQTRIQRREQICSDMYAMNLQAPREEQSYVKVNEDYATNRTITGSHERIHPNYERQSRSSESCGDGQGYAYVREDERLHILSPRSIGIRPWTWRVSRKASIVIV